MEIQISRRSQTPIYMQIRNQIRDQIELKILAPGYRLPPERKLAAILGVNRSTVVNAYRELEADGCIESHVGKGTLVRDFPRDSLKTGPTVQPLIWNEFYNALANRSINPVLNNILEQIGSEDVISFAVGAPSYETYPVKDLEQSFNGLAGQGYRQVFEYGSTAGYSPLREYLSSYLQAKGIKAKPENILILSGSQQGLDLIARSMIEPGDTVIVEEPTYIGAINVFQGFGAHLLSIPIDHEGMRTDLLEQILTRRRPKLIYTLPTFQNPSGYTLSPSRRAELLRLAYKYHVPVLEDDPYGEIYYGQHPPAPLKAMDDCEHVIYLSTFSKILLPGLRVGWCVAPSPLVEQLTLTKQGIDLHTGTTGQWLIESFCRKGLMAEHLRQIRQAYAAKRNAMINALERYAPAGLTWDVPQGGFYLWCKLPPEMTAGALLNRSSTKKVVFLPGNACYPGHGGSDRIRLSFSRYPVEIIEEGIRLLTETMKEFLNSHQSPPVSSLKYAEIKPIV